MNHLDHIRDAVDFIEEHLEDQLTLPDVAAVAGYSLFYFSRTFHALLGETVESYVRKRRLASAAHDLLESELGILDVATRYRFGSQAAFTRSFSSLFGVAPGAYRRRAMPLFIERLPLTPESLEHVCNCIDVKPTIMHRPAFTVVGMRFVWSVNDGYNLPAWWREFRPRIPEISGRSSANEIGVCEYIANDEFTVETRLQYVAGVPVSSVGSLPAGLVCKRIPEADYAMFIHRGGMDTVMDSCRYILGIWLPCSGYCATDSDNFEVYEGGSLKAQEPQEPICIYLPVEKVTQS